MMAITECGVGPTKSATPERSADPRSSGRNSAGMGHDFTPSPELTVVVPTLNEVGNVEALHRAIADALDGIDWEVLFVDDDSTDGTLSLIRSLARADRPLSRVFRQTYTRRSFFRDAP